MSDQIADLDPRWEWIDVREFSDPGPKWLRGPCRHLEAVPVESGGETVAHLCTTCDEQLPEEWRP